VENCFAFETDNPTDCGRYYNFQRDEPDTETRRGAVAMTVSRMGFDTVGVDETRGGTVSTIDRLRPSFSFQAVFETE
jgi:hypothetical protein